MMDGAEQVSSAALTGSVSHTSRIDMCAPRNWKAGCPLASRTSKESAILKTCARRITVLVCQFYSSTAVSKSYF